MAKAKKKHSGKRTNLDMKMPKKTKQEVTKWEELITIKDECVNSLLHQQMLLKSLMDKFPEKVNSVKEVRETIEGTFKSLTDIAKKVRQNMEFHMTIDKDDNVVDYKKGIVDPETEDYMSFITCSGNYIFAQEQIAAISASGFTELLTLLNDGSVKQEDIDSINTSYLGEQVSLINTIQNAMEKQK